MTTRDLIRVFVRAAIVMRWSSVHANLGLQPDPIVLPHPSFLALGSAGEPYTAAYRTILHEGDDEQETDSIRVHVAKQRAYGDARFQAMVEKTLHRPATVRSRGRPRKVVDEDA